MQVEEAQREMRTVFTNGAVGQAVSGGIWLASAALGTWVSQRAGIIALVALGVLVFPLTQLAHRLLGRRSSASRENPFNALAMQAAFVLPLCLPVIGAATLYNANWFYPAFMVVLGAHYLPFMTLYGMWQFGVLAAVLIGGGVAIGMTMPDTFSTGGWVAAAALLLFALLVWPRESRRA